MCVFIQICPAHAQPSGCLFSAVQLLPPSFGDFFKIIRRLFRLSAAVHAFALGCHDALGLPLADVVPFGLSDIAEDLQDQIRDECPGEVLFLFPGVEQRHVQDDDIDLLFLGDDLPLLQDLFIIPSQRVDRMQIEDISRSELLHHPQIARARKAAPGLFVHEDVLFGHAVLLHGKQLPFLMLFSGGHPYISILLPHVFTSCCFMEKANEKTGDHPVPLSLYSHDQLRKTAFYLVLPPLHNAGPPQERRRCHRRKTLLRTGHAAHRARSPRAAPDRRTSW